MKLNSQGVRQAFDNGIALSARFIAQAMDSFARQPVVVVSGAANGVYRVAGDEGRTLTLTDKGFCDASGLLVDSPFRAARVELDLPSDMFLFRELDFPAKALDFLDGVLRAQIDRFTPWSDTQVVFGHSAPMPAGHDRIKLTIAAAPLKQIMPIVRAFDAAGAASVVVNARREDGAGASILVHESAFHRERATLKAERALKSALVGVLAFAGVSVGASSLAGAWLETKGETIAAETHQWRQAQMSGARDPDVMLHKRKIDTPLVVLVMEQLARILPDDTFLREISFGEGKIEIAGVSADATRLIVLLERSPTFTRATFSAPTTHSANEPGDQFHIQAQVNARYGKPE